MNVKICRSCLVGAEIISNKQTHSDQEKISKLEMDLSQKAPQIQWNVELVSCMDLCPDQKVALSFDLPQSEEGQIITTSDDAALESIVKKCLERLNC